MDVDDVDTNSLIPSLVFENDESLQVEDVFPADSLFTLYTENSIRSPGDQDNTFAQIKEEEKQHHEQVSSTEEIEVPEEEDEIRLRFVLNLYGPEEGYSYGMLDPELGETPESHLLPYSEKYIIDCIDNGVIPWKVITVLKETVGRDLISCEGTVLAEVRDYRHFSTVMPNTAKIRHVMLRTTNESLLSELDNIVEEGFRERSVLEQRREPSNQLEDFSDELKAIDSGIYEENCRSPTLPSSNNDSIKCSPPQSTSSSSSMEDEEETFCIDIKEEPMVDDEDGSSLDDDNSLDDDPDATADDSSEDEEQEIETSPPDPPVAIKEEPHYSEFVSMSMNHLVSPIKMENFSSPQQFTISVKQETPSTAHLEYNSTIFDGEMSSARSNSYNKSDVDCDYSSKHFLPVNCRIVKQGVMDSSSINDKDMITNFAAQNISESYGNGMCKVYVCSPCNSNEKETDLSRYNGSENVTMNGNAVIIPGENSNNYVGCYTMKIDEYEENCDSSFTQILNDMEMNNASKNNSSEEVVRNCIDVQSNVDERCNILENGIEDSNRQENEDFSHNKIKAESEPAEMNGEYSFQQSYSDMEVEESAYRTESEEDEKFLHFQTQPSIFDDDNENCGSDEGESDGGNENRESVERESDGENVSQDEAKTDYDSNSEDYEEDDFENENNNSGEDSEEENIDEELNCRFFVTKCDHKYDRQHYKGIRSGSSSESDSESDTSSESCSEESSSSESDSITEENCQIAAIHEGDHRTDLPILHLTESIRENSDSDSKSDSPETDSENSSETEYFDETKHRWLPDQHVIEEDDCFITDQDPFDPEKISPQKEHFDEDAGNFSGHFVSTDEFDGEDVGYHISYDDSPSVEIVHEGVLKKELHPKALVKGHQLALFGRELNDDENALIDSDDDSFELEEDLEADEEEDNDKENGGGFFEKYSDDVEAENFFHLIANEEEFQKNLEFISIEDCDEMEETSSPDGPVSDETEQTFSPDGPITDEIEYTFFPDGSVTDDIGYSFSPDGPVTNEIGYALSPDNPVSEVIEQKYSPEKPVSEEMEKKCTPLDPGSDEIEKKYSPDYPYRVKTEQKFTPVDVGPDEIDQTFTPDYPGKVEIEQKFNPDESVINENDNEQKFTPDDFGSDNDLSGEEDESKESEEEDQSEESEEENQSDESEDDSEILGYCLNELPADIDEDEVLILDEDPEPSSNNELNQQYFSDSDSNSEHESNSSEEEEEPVLVLMEDENGHMYTDNLENFDEEEQDVILSSLQDCYLVEENEGQGSVENLDDSSESDNDERQYYNNEENDIDMENEEQDEEQISSSESLESDEDETNEDVYNSDTSDKNEIPVADEDINLMAALVAIPDDELSDSELRLDDEQLNLNAQETEMLSEAVKGIIDGTHFDLLAEQIKCALENEFGVKELDDLEVHLAIDNETIEKDTNELENEDESNVENAMEVYQQAENMEEQQEIMVKVENEDVKPFEDMEQDIVPNPQNALVLFEQFSTVPEQTPMEIEHEDIGEQDIEEENVICAEDDLEEYLSSGDEESENELPVEMEDFVNQFGPSSDEDEDSEESKDDDSEMTREEIDEILESEDCDDVLREITSDILLEAATGDCLVKGLKLSFVQDMNEFVQSAYEKYLENPVASKYASMTKEELEQEIQLEMAADEFCKNDPDYDPYNLDGLDARLYKSHGENREYFKELDQQLFTKQEWKDFMHFNFSIEDFCPDEDDSYMEKLFNVENIDESEESLGNQCFDFMDELYFLKESVLSCLEEQLEEGIEAEINQSDEEDEPMEEVEEEEDVEDDVEQVIDELIQNISDEEIKNEDELSYDQRLNLEETLVNTTSEKLCLDPSPLVGILSNRLQFEKLKWNAPEIKNAMRNWVAPEPPIENLFHKVYKSNPDNDQVKAHLKRKRSALVRKPRSIEPTPNRSSKGIKRPRALLEPREMTLSKLLCPDMDEDTSPPPDPEEEDTFYDSPESFQNFFQFVVDTRAKKAASKRNSDKDERQLSFEEKIADPATRRKMLTLEPPQIIDFMDVEAPSNYDVIKKVFKTPEPAMIQSFPIENTCRVIEEYLLETDRRKKPHYTKVTIYQRNYLENYHGEVLMESLFEPTAPSPLGKFPKIPPYTTCEFGLGCSSDVALYIKQFLDIFSEDGKRACKVTCHKVGQPFPFVVATPYYKPIFPEPPIPKEFQFTIGPSTVNPYPSYMERNMKFPTQGFTQNLTHLYYPSGPNQHNHYVNQLLLNQNNNYSQSNSNSYGFLGHSLYSSNASASSSTSSSTSTSQPPVQIVHPQPRPVQQQQTQQIIVSSAAAAASISSGQIYAASSNNPVLSQTIQQPASANVNFNLNVNSSGIVGISPQQVLTRPHIVNVNVQQQPQQQTIQTRAVNVPTQQQLHQLAQQRNLRMRQQQLQKQQQYIQQHPTALAKLLTSNIQGHVGANKPITVAVPPQPQNPNKIANPPQSPSETLTMSIGSPIEHHTIQHHPTNVSPSPNVNVNVNTAPNVNVNLNTISLDGLLSGTPSGINYSTSNNIVTSNVSVVGNNRIVSGTSISPATALNILRLNTGGGTTGNVNLINTNNLSRGLTVSNLNSNNVSIMSQPQQRILVNSAGNVVATQNQQQLGELEEISVTDLNSFLNSQQIQICQLGVGQQVALSQNHPQLQQQLQLQQTTIPQQHIQTLDSHNVNLNLNVNLNSGNAESSQQIAKIQGGDWTTTTNSNAPFVVFISPLTRPLSADNSGQVSRAGGSSSTVNVNLAAIQTTPPHSSQQSQTIVLEAAPSGAKAQNHQQFDSQNLISSEIVGVTSDGVAVDTLFNALSDAIGPELGKKLDVIGSVVGPNTVVVSSTVNVPISSPVIQSRISPQSHLPTYSLINMQSAPSSSPKFTSHVAPSQQQNVITLNDLLASPTIVSSSTGGNFSGSTSFVLSSNNGTANNSNAGALLSPISKPSPSPGPSINSSHITNVASSTPRLSALLAGSPSADSMLSASNTLSILSDTSSLGHHTTSGTNTLLANSIDASQTSSYGNLLDRLAASLSQPPGTASQIRSGVSRLNPIASATPNVVLEHPMLAASLTQQSTTQPTNRATAYRQIAPAPPPNLVQHAHAQPQQQLINLLGLNPTGQTRTIRISATTPVTGKPSPSSGNMGAGR